MQNWILDKLYALGVIVATLQQEVSDLKSQAATAERTELEHRSARPALWQVVLGAVGVLCAIGSLVVSIIALIHH